MYRSYDMYTANMDMHGHGLEWVNSCNKWPVPNYIHQRIIKYYHYINKMHKMFKQYSERCMYLGKHNCNYVHFKPRTTIQITVTCTKENMIAVRKNKITKWLIESSIYVISSINCYCLFEYYASWPHQYVLTLWALGMSTLASTMVTMLIADEYTRQHMSADEHILTSMSADENSPQQHMPAWLLLTSINTHPQMSADENNPQQRMSAWLLLTSINTRPHMSADEYTHSHILADEITCQPHMPAWLLLTNTR